MAETKKLPKLTKKQEGFVRDYIETGNGTEAAVKNYNTSRDVARRIASENLTKLDIQARIQAYTPKAQTTIEELSQQRENLPVALNAAKDILDRAGYKPVEKIQSENMNFNILVMPELTE